MATCSCRPGAHEKPNLPGNLFWWEYEGHRVLAYRVKHHYLQPVPDGGEKDTLRNCKPIAEGGTGEFVVNLAVEAYRHEVSAAGEPLPHGESEFDLTGLETAPALAVNAPRVAASPVAYECRTREVIRLAPEVPGGANLVIGEVVHLHVLDDLVDDRLNIDADRLAAIGRMGGLEYCRTRDRFTMPRGRAALEKEE